MDFGSKLQALRKSKALSQEALAEKLNVSRQAVSKWETGEGYPEMDKLILLTDLFQVTLDYLIKDNQDPSSQQDLESKYFMSSQKIKDYIQFETTYAYRIAIGVCAIILSTLFPLLLNGTRYESLGSFVMLIIVAMSIALLILTGMSSNDYDELKKKEINMSYNDSQDLQVKQTKFKSKFGMMIASGVCLIIMSVAVVALLDDYIGDTNFGSAQFIVCIAIAVFLFITAGLKDEMYSFLVQNKKYVNKHRHSLNKYNNEDHSLYGITMPLAAMIYLVMGFTQGWWHPGWIIFPVTAILTSGIVTFMARDK